MKTFILDHSHQKLMIKFSCKLKSPILYTSGIFGKLDTDNTQSSNEKCFSCKNISGLSAYQKSEVSGQFPDGQFSDGLFPDRFFLDGQQMWALYWVNLKFEKDIFTVFTSFQNKYLKANSRKSLILRRSDNVVHINVGEDQLSSRKYEELLDTFIAHKWTFEDHFLNIVQKINQKIHILERISNTCLKRSWELTWKN